MARENRSRGYARPLSLTPPPTHMQFAVERVRASIKQRVAKKALDKALDKGADDDKASARAINTAELPASGLPSGIANCAPTFAAGGRRLHHLLAAVLAGEEGAAAIWWATLSALREARRAAEVPIGARPRKWRQSYPDPNGW